MSARDFSWQEHIVKIAAKGLLAKQLHVIQTTPVNRLQLVLDNLQEELASHELKKSGVMFAAGPIADDSESHWEGEGMVIIRAASIDEARNNAAQDPVHKSGARTRPVRPWLPNVGSLTRKVICSDGKREVLQSGKDSSFGCDVLARLCPC